MQKSFSYAFRGIGDALKSEPNLRIHFMFSFLTILLAVYLKFTWIEFAILTLTIFLVIILEFVNTIIEKLSDITHPEQSEKIRFIKDMSAATVLMAAVCSIIVGLILFLPKLW
ncbi:hypothetical protein A2130_04230 [Candidatus Woesebacteria bacterium GWC2_33_12]|uniref:Prokaryotic diacylglycerol kinase n=1 Tax=Candidatus Woesebacteria bacterium GW2011_GWB1_33_22 TaxID=1618566 RepID=A0A0G0CK62_9BACT|nr:MAG: Prokaryotic diacylglycerol kinase [Candidatus Woesebacteria bacterium GW2011_GWC2_33_12]KKP41447.1 MAG: Prokaryotic diacylglycerol kinase [Candidatus Woesebacteria bacterium GW2011_GWA2_33_20]KKP43827.1 MAG: Prokaryotic diacylglycerol kinase [Candidatus Woesebacteria bacterium GW2011_GWB1_33_22]KKP45397.1 MAG: Prokaryotic diacylglycerol kinase [Microgenomates group bacterium GW2011_GWC1_33_28]KKP49279.1 MAG: Prokaryotic diacylglycerol kinase [Candidatus Woesebacteria bacterium GW2011_GW